MGYHNLYVDLFCFGSTFWQTFGQGGKTEHFAYRYSDILHFVSYSGFIKDNVDAAGLQTDAGYWGVYDLQYQYSDSGGCF